MRRSLTDEGATSDPTTITTQRTVTSKGVKLHGIIYNSKELQKHFRGLNRTHVLATYNPADLSHVIVQAVSSNEKSENTPVSLKVFAISKLALPGTAIDHGGAKALAETVSHSVVSSDVQNDGSKLISNVKPKRNARFHDPVRWQFDPPDISSQKLAEFMRDVSREYLKCLSMVKREVEAKRGMIKWAAQGVPKRIILEQRREFCSSSFTEAMYALGIEYELRPVMR
jgi:hypothetical protein